MDAGLGVDLVVSFGGKQKLGRPRNSAIRTHIRVAVLNSFKLEREQTSEQMERKLINPNSKLYYVLSVVFSLLLLPIILVGSFVVAFVVVGAALSETLYKLLIYERRRK